MVIGKDGAKLKAVATAARRDMEKLFGGKVFLEIVGQGAARLDGGRDRVAPLGLRTCLTGTGWIGAARSCCMPTLTARRACSSRPSLGRMGGLPVLAKGARRPGSAMRGILLAFQPMDASWSGRGEVRTLVRCEWLGGHPLLGGSGSFAASI